MKSSVVISRRRLASPTTYSKRTRAAPANAAFGQVIAELASELNRALERREYLSPETQALS